MALLDFLGKRKSTNEAGGEMSFIDHLEELRWHIIRCVIAILAGAVVVYIFIRDIVDKILFAPTDKSFVSYKWFCDLSHWLRIGDALCLNGVEAKFQANTMTGQFISSFTLAFMGGFIVAFPYVFWEFWRFVRPALSDTERKRTRGAVFWVSLLFFMGVGFGYFVLTPFMINFYFSYTLSDKIVVLPTFSDYMENLVYTTVGIGILFQLPLLIYILARIGIVTSAFLKQYWRHALVMILIVAAIITPTTDPFSLLIVTLPLYLLYQAGIWITMRVEKNKAKKIKEWS
jgi:sec-independent protein translocase protein TatC